MDKQQPSGLHFSKGFLKFSAIFLLSIILLMAFLHWRKGDYSLEVKQVEPVEETVK